MVMIKQRGLSISRSKSIVINYSGYKNKSWYWFLSPPVFIGKKSGK